MCATILFDKHHKAWPSICGVILFAQKNNQSYN